MNHTNKDIIYKNPKVKHRFDKQLININQTSTNAVINTTIFAAATYPAVVMGLVISGCSSCITAALAPFFQWFLVIVEQGTTVSVPAFGGSAYAPEQQVMAFGAGVLQPGMGCQFFVKTKTGRKIRTGDTIVFIVQSNIAGAAVNHCYNVQFFLKV